MTIRFDGADISHHQVDNKPPIDWAALRAASLAGWVATKATQSTTYTDPTCDTHRAQMSAQGFTHRGFYHWISPNTDPTHQAHHYLNCIGTLHPGEFVMLDAEEGGVTAAMVLEWLDAVEAITRRPASVYTGAYVAGGTIWQSTEIRHSAYGPRPMHLAAYTTEEKAKKLPGVAAYPWSAWQYSSNGPVPGIFGRCDMNRIDRIDHYNIAAGISFPPPPPPTPGDPDMAQVITNDESAQYQGVVYPRGNIKWVIDRPNAGDDKGTKRHLEGAEHAAYGSPVGTYLNNAQLFDLPDYIPSTDGGDGVDLEARGQIAKLESVTAQLNDAVGRTGQVIGDMQKGLSEAADARA